MGLVDVGRLRREGSRLLSQHVALDDSVGWVEGEEEVRRGEASGADGSIKKKKKVWGGRGKEKKEGTEN